MCTVVAARVWGGGEGEYVSTGYCSSWDSDMPRHIRRTWTKLQRISGIFSSLFPLHERQGHLRVTHIIWFTTIYQGQG